MLRYNEMKLRAPMICTVLVQYCVITVGGDQFEADACVSFDENRNPFLNVKWNVSIECLLCN